MRPTALSASAIVEWLNQHPEWKSSGSTLSRTFVFDGYADALGFVVTLGAHAQKEDHHPDLNLTWGKVTVSLSTHDAGGITQLDLDFAAKAETYFGSNR